MNTLEPQKGRQMVSKAHDIQRKRHVLEYTVRISPQPAARTRGVVSNRCVVVDRAAAKFQQRAASDHCPPCSRRTIIDEH